MPAIFLQIECEAHKGDEPCFVFGVGPDTDTVEELLPLFNRIANVIRTMPGGTDIVDELEGNHDGG